jgi:flagellin-like protein
MQPYWSALKSRKRGLSDVITTVMLIALTIIVVGVVWIGVIPMIRDRMGSSDSCMGAEVSVENSQGYTCWDRAKNISMVQIRAGSIDVNVSGFRFFISTAGNSVYFPKQSYAVANSYNVFYLNTSGIYSIEKFGVAAVIRNGKTTKECPNSFVDVIKTCDVGVVDPSIILNSSLQK